MCRPELNARSPLAPPSQAGTPGSANGGRPVGPRQLRRGPVTASSRADTAGPQAALAPLPAPGQEAATLPPRGHGHAHARGGGSDSPTSTGDQPAGVRHPSPARRRGRCFREHRQRHGAPTQTAKAPPIQRRTRVGAARRRKSTETHTHSLPGARPAAGPTVHGPFAQDAPHAHRLPARCRPPPPAAADRPERGPARQRTCETRGQ